MERGKSSKLRWFVRIAVVVAITLVVWWLVGFHVTEPRGSITAAEAESITGLRVPPEATNIRAASYRQFIERAEYLRFEAPVDVCLRFASTVVPQATLRPVNEYQLERDARPPRPDALSDFSWFDLDEGKNVVAAGGGSGRPKVYVDQDRGVFYYRMTD